MLSGEILKSPGLAVQCEETQEEYFQRHWARIETAVVGRLLASPNLGSVVPLRRSLQTLLNRHQYPLLHEHLIRLFYSLYKQIISKAAQCDDSLHQLLTYYNEAQPQYKLVFALLDGFLSPHAPRDRPSLETEAYRVLCKEIINVGLAEKIAREFMALVEAYRSRPFQDLKGIEDQLRIIKLLGIYECCEAQFLQKSKNHFIDLASKIPKNENIFKEIQNSLTRETTLSRILLPSESTLYYLQKELIEQYFPHMIQFVDYLIHQDKKGLLRILWQFTSRLGLKQSELLNKRFEQIIKDCSKYLKEDGNIVNILDFLDQMTNTISQCFEGSKILKNLLSRTLQQLLTEQERNYNSLLSKQILTLNPQQNLQTLFRLFRLVPNKENFIRQLEVRFLRWVLNTNLAELSFQQSFVQLVRRQCGTALCKKFQRMLLDVWRDGNMVFYRNKVGNFKCRMLSVEWPKFNYTNFALPDPMQAIIDEFEIQFKRPAENSCKQIKWVSEYGNLELTIFGLDSIFSEAQAAILMVIERSIRPMRKDQLSQILQIKLVDLEAIVDELHNNSILNLNDHNGTYELNERNDKSYRYQRVGNQDVQAIKTLNKRDDSIVIEAVIVKILKKQKSKCLQKTDLTKFVTEYIHNFKPTIQQINKALQKLTLKEYIDIDKSKGLIRYRE